MSISVKIRISSISWSSLTSSTINSDPLGKTTSSSPFTADMFST